MNLSALLQLNVPLVLASQSPRRVALLRQIGLDPEVVPAHLDEEEHAASLQPEEYAAHLAVMKARTTRLTRMDDCIVIGADTIVVLDDVILNKPVDADDAYRMLRMLSGHTHTVITAVSVQRGTRELVAQKKTLVTFRELRDEEIRAYISGGSPMDKAGSYGIQDDYGAVFVKHIEGCYYNIVGLPLEMLFELLQEISHETSTT